MLTGSPYVGLQMTCYDLLNRPLPKYIDDPFVMQLAKLMTGATAGIIAQTVTYPGDTVRRRMQTNGMGGEARLYSNSWDCLVKVVRNEGVGMLFAGSFANVVRGIPGAAIQFWAYDGVKLLLGI
jgi:solute carrier family 25 phosphate transporter 23/24/25/41